MAARNGVVTLTGTPRLASGRHEDLLPVAIRLMWDVDGVVDIVDKFAAPQSPVKAAQSAQQPGQPQEKKAG